MLMLARLLLLITVVSTAGCTDRPPKSPGATAGANFPVAYELVSGRSKSALLNETVMTFFDPSSGQTISARRDPTGLSAWGSDETERCDFGDYCIKMWELPRPIIVFAVPEKTFEYQGWKYDVSAADIAEASCERYSAGQIGGTARFQYVHCANGVIFIAAGGEKQDVYELRSWLGLGSTVEMTSHLR